MACTHSFHGADRHVHPTWWSGEKFVNSVSSGCVSALWNQFRNFGWFPTLCFVLGIPGGGVSSFLDVKELCYGFA